MQTVLIGTQHFFRAIQKYISKLGYCKSLVMKPRHLQECFGHNRRLPRTTQHQWYAYVLVAADGRFSNGIAMSINLTFASHQS